MDGNFNQKDVIVIKKILALACVFLSGISVGIAGNYVFGTPEIYGPFVCDACTLRNPAPDVATRAYIDYRDNWLNDGPNYTRLVGDKFVVCNATHCATYTRSASGDYMGSPAVPQNTGGGGGGGNGGGSGIEDGGPGGGFGGSDCSVIPRTGTACSTVNGVSRCETFADAMVDCGFG